MQTMRVPASHRGKRPAPMHSQQVAEGVFQVSLSIVNVFLVGRAGSAPGKWVLVDAGHRFSAAKILRAVEELYGPESYPKAIILTHGHFDHRGAAEQLAELWQVPIYCHPMEAPYLDGRSAYPPPDPGVGGGGMSLMSPLYSRGPVRLGRRLRMLPSGGGVPGMPGWDWIHTPGHTPGHVSLYREADGVLLAGDAFVTTRQESMFGALVQPREIHGPPMYFTSDWEMAYRSVMLLSRIPIRVAGTGHGRPMGGPRLRYGLQELAENFWRDAVPSSGRYVDTPALADRDGVSFVPDRHFNLRHVAFAALAVGALRAFSLVKAIRR